MKIRNHKKKYFRKQIFVNKKSYQLDIQVRVYRGILYPHPKRRIFLYRELFLFS